MRVILLPHGYDIISETLRRTIKSISGAEADVVSIGFVDSKPFRKNGSMSVSSQIFKKYWRHMFTSGVYNAARFYESFCIRPCSFADEKPLPRLKDFLEDFFDRMNRNSLVADCVWDTSRDWDNANEVVFGPINAIRCN